MSDEAATSDSREKTREENNNTSSSPSQTAEIQSANPSSLVETRFNDEKSSNNGVSGQNLKRPLEDDTTGESSSKAAKNDSSPPASSFPVKAQSTSHPTVIQTSHGEPWKPEKGKVIAGFLTEDRLAEMLAISGTAPVLPHEEVEGPVVTGAQIGTLSELLDEEYARQLVDEDDERDVAAVLGDCSDKECSYDKGYMKRQALYSCVTCYNKTREVAGICLACTYACHDGHDFVELYTKRNFRCDCGNSKFTGLACKLTPNKDILNERNQYNQNFVNKYCTCRRPHPDPELEEMVQVQCTFCEDWFHLEHVQKSTDNWDALLETPRSLVCVACREKHSFTNYYIAEEGDLVGEFDAMTPECQIEGCGLKFLQKKFETLPAIDEAGWTPLDWYSSVCRCDSCKKLYIDEKVEFLLDADESVAAYEEKGLAKVELERQQARTDALTSPDEQIPDAMQALLVGMDRIAQIEFANNMNDFKTSLRQRLLEINERGEIVQSHHIAEFFDEERRKMRQRMEQLQQGDRAGLP